MKINPEIAIDILNRFENFNQYLGCYNIRQAL